MTRTAQAQRSRLSAVDRCDRCGAQAYVQVGFFAGSELFFCTHHARLYQDKLREVAVMIRDESERLTEVPATPRTLVHPSQRWRF
jgi:hypothetical protein